MFSIMDMILIGLILLNLIYSLRQVSKNNEPKGYFSASAAWFLLLGTYILLIHTNYQLNQIIDAYLEMLDNCRDMIDSYQKMI